jgi:hypothetical protein
MQCWIIRHRPISHRGCLTPLFLAEFSLSLFESNDILKNSSKKSSKKSSKIKLVSEAEKQFGSWIFQGIDWGK